MIEVIKSLLQKIIVDIESGNSNITEDNALEIINVIKSYTDKTQKLSKYQACQKLNISRATFDNLVRKGSLPKGQKIAGFKELFWTMRDIEAVLHSRKNKQ